MTDPVIDTVEYHSEPVIDTDEYYSGHPHKVALYDPDTILLNLWCIQQFGTRFSKVSSKIFGSKDGVWTWVWISNKGIEYRFKHESDAILFSLRWS
jgi:hypothetical protein